MEFVNTTKKIVDYLESVPDNKIRRALYDVLNSPNVMSVNGNIDEIISIYRLDNWQGLLTFLLTEPRYQSSQGLYNWFYDLYLTDADELEQNALLFILPIILSEIDRLNIHAFWALSEMLVKHIDREKLNDFIDELQTSDSVNSIALLNTIKYEIQRGNN